MADDFTNKAMAFIEANATTRPFFCYIPFNTPHSPMQVPDAYWNRFSGNSLPMRYAGAGEDLNNTRAALAMVENLDWNVGRILNKLDSLNIANNTIVTYFSDNGPSDWRWNGGLRGKKGSTDEGGVRSPLLVRWRGTFTAGKKIDRIAATIDLLPTLADLVGIPLNISRPLDGITLAPLMTGNPSTWADRTIINYWNSNISARNQRYRLDSQNRLYDIDTDSAQVNNVAASFPNVVTTLTAAKTNYQNLVLTGFPARPFTLGHPNFGYYGFPAGEASITGNIQRSSVHPNSSFLRNWTSVSDRITWNVDVLAAGQFDVTIYYACPASDTGARIEFSLNGAVATGRVTPAWNPPLRGMENDRVPRIESYIKDWRTLSLGTISLPMGQGNMVIRALSVPGGQVMEFRELFLTRRSTVDARPNNSAEKGFPNGSLRIKKSGPNSLLSLRMEKKGQVLVELFSYNGRLHSIPVNNVLAAGNHDLLLSSSRENRNQGGVFFVRVTVNGIAAVNRIVAID